MVPPQEGLGSSPFRFRSVQIGEMDVVVAELETHAVDLFLEEVIARTEANPEKSESDPYGVILWPSAFAIAKEIQQLCGSSGLPASTLELGAGTGLCSLVCAKMGIKSVLATDIEQLSLQLVQLAAEMQGFEGISTGAFDVCDSALELPPADLVFASDLMYSNEVARSLGRRCMEAKARGSRVLVGDPGRPGRGAFLEGLQESGGTVAKTRKHSVNGCTIDVLEL